MGKPPTWEKLEPELSCQKDYFILEQLIEDAEEKFEILMKYQALLEIRQANHQERLTVIRKWAEILDKHERTLSRLLQSTFTDLTFSAPL